MNDAGFFSEDACRAERTRESRDVPVYGMRIVFGYLNFD